MAKLRSTSMARPCYADGAFSTVPSSQPPMAIGPQTLGL
jgi:hypothetical protein